MSIGARLREERQRLALSQPAFAALALTTKQTLFSWESDKTAPDAVQLAALAAEGVDVLYVIAGMRDEAAPALDQAERVLVDNYRSCSPTAKANLIQSSALLAAGVASQDEATAPRSMKLKNAAAGAVQVAAGRNSFVVTGGRKVKAG